MKITVMASLFAKRDMEINARHVGCSVFLCKEQKYGSFDSVLILFLEKASLNF
jgi:hypothetical protein